MSGLLRALCAPPAVRCLRLLPPPLTPDDEPAFLEAAQQLLREVVASSWKPRPSLKSARGVGANSCPRQGSHV